MEFKTDDETTYIISELNLAGYDVIIVNHPSYTVNGVAVDGGADYIERNGLVHASFYQEINKNLTSNGNYDNQLVAMGPSMGGLIARYALAFMEKKYEETSLDKWQHNTRLYVSVDSPHLGANISYGVQTLLYSLMDDSVDAADYVKKELKSPATQQLLIEQMGSHTEYTGDGWNGNPTWTTFNHMDGRTISQGFSEDKGNPMYIELALV